MGRILYDSSVVNHGDSVNVETACKKAYERRTQEYLAIYGTDYKDRLTFKNDMDYYGISVEWDEYSTGFSHNVLNDHYGEKNDNLNQDDTVIIKNKVYENVYKASEKHGDLSRRNYYYSFLNGFVFIHDKEIQKKWYLLEAY
ncbi:MAG: hypothetical protein KDC92_04075 [Bacteroidetes bacterium]|nr:hypothetical protein [Bacteroidota bacterium]